MPSRDRVALRRTFLAALATAGASCAEPNDPIVPETPVPNHLLLRASPPSFPIAPELAEEMRKEGATFTSIDLRTPGAYPVEILNVAEGPLSNHPTFCDTDPCAPETLRLGAVDLYTRALVVRDGAKVRVVFEADFASTFGAVDSPEKAAVRLAVMPSEMGLARCADLAAYGAPCGEGSSPDGVPVRTADDGSFQVVLYGVTNVCADHEYGRGRALQVYRVTKEGQISIEESALGRASALAARADGNARCEGMMLGRMFEGYVDAPLGADLRAYLARAARQEAAAVHAFERLTEELAGFGAPATLIAAARRGAEDERRHARLFEEALAGLGGGRGEPQAVHHATPPARWRARSLFEVLVENAVEGCANESYAALVATHQADADAGAPAALRPLFAEIAEDERAHAALAFEIHRWGRALLDERERRALDAALAGALLSIATCRPTALGRALGEPLPEVAGPAFDAVVRALQV